MKLQSFIRITEQLDPDNQNIATDLSRLDRQIKEVFDQRCPESFQEHPRLMRICRYAINSRAFYTLIDPPTDRSTSRNLFYDPETELLIGECNCTDSPYQEIKPAYDRLSSTRRAEIESAFLEKFIATHPNRNQPIRIACLGTGFMADTNLLIARMVFNGYTDLEFFCIDPIYAHSPNAVNCLNQVASTYFNLPHVSVKLNGRTGVENLPEIDAFIAVDFDGLFENFPSRTVTNSLLSIGKVAGNLRKDGFGVLGLKNFGDLFFPSLDETPQKWNTQGIQAIYEDMRKNLPDRKEFHVCIPYSWFENTPEFLIALVGALKSKKQVPEKLVLSFPCALLPGVDRIEQKRIKDHPQPILPREIEEGIVTFLKLLLPDTEMIVNLQPSKEARFDMILSNEDFSKVNEFLQAKEFLNAGGVLYLTPVSSELNLVCNVIANKEGKYCSSQLRHLRF